MSTQIKKLLLVAGTLAAASMFTGCASIVSKWSYPVQIESQPSGAHFKITNRKGEIVARGVTPAEVKLDAGYSYFRRERYVVDFSTVPGEVQASEEIRAKLDPWYWGNIIIGGAIGMVFIDPLTGAMYKLPDSCTGVISGANTDDFSYNDDFSDDAQPQTRSKAQPQRQSVDDDWDSF